MGSFPRGARASYFTHARRATGMAGAAAAVLAAATPMTTPTPFPAAEVMTQSPPPPMLLLLLLLLLLMLIRLQLVPATLPRTTFPIPVAARVPDDT